MGIAAILQKRFECLFFPRLWRYELLLRFIFQTRDKRKNVFWEWQSLYKHNYLHFTLIESETLFTIHSSFDGECKLAVRFCKWHQRLSILKWLCNANVRLTCWKISFSASVTHTHVQYTQFSQTEPNCTLHRHQSKLNVFDKWLLVFVTNNIRKKSKTSAPCANGFRCGRR